MLELVECNFTIFLFTQEDKLKLLDAYTYMYAWFQDSMYCHNKEFIKSTYIV